MCGTVVLFPCLLGPLTLPYCGKLIYIQFIYKMHLQGNPGRPPISSVGCHISNISFESMAQQIPSYILGTSDFLQKINAIETIPDD